VHGGTLIFLCLLSDPPQSPPNITGYTTRHPLTIGQQLFLECRVYGGNPLVQSVTFFCSNSKDSDKEDNVVSNVGEDSSYVSSNLTISVAKEDNGIECTCMASWEDGNAYVQTNHVILTVVGKY
jgi:hypothetical protein